MPKKKKEYKYYVSYFYHAKLQGNIRLLPGDCTVTLDKPLDTVKVIADVTKFISQKFCAGSKAFINNWKVLKE